jgi:hypothetical protein
VSLLRQFRVYAANQNQSMSRLAAEAIRKLVDEKDQRELARQRMLARLKNPPGRLKGGEVTWTRDELYEEMLAERSKSGK